MKKVSLLAGFLVVGIFGIFSFVIDSHEYTQKKEEVKEVAVVPLLFTGDIMLGRYVETLKNTTGLDPFGDTAEFLKSHTTIVNLEGPIPSVHEPTPISGFTFSFASSTPKYLKDHGVRAVSLANNHSMDHGRSGYEATKQSLDLEGISHFGGYGTTEPDYFETKLGTTTVIVYGINMISSTWNERAAHAATKLLRQNHPGAYLAAFIHWGNEYDLKQGVVQQVFAHKLIDEGVNAIIGSHPHVTQGIEIYKNSPIFYSLGNFIFDQYFSNDTQRGYTVSIDKKDSHLVFQLIPVTSVRSKTMIVDSLLSQTILDGIAKSSQTNLQEEIRKGVFTLKF